MVLNGKTAVVTGAARGIGKALTEMLLQNGAKVALLDVNESGGKTLETALEIHYGQGKVVFLKCDVESKEEIKAAFQNTKKTFGGIDIVCNNAGIVDEVNWEKSVSINLVGVISVAYEALEHMSVLNGGRGGVVVNTASLAGLKPLASCPVYTATKYGVIGFTRAMAAASSALGYGIRFNALCPDIVQTDFISDMEVKLGQFSDLSHIIKDAAKTRLLDVSQVAESVLELVMDETKTGEALMCRKTENKYMAFE